MKKILFLLLVSFKLFGGTFTVTPVALDSNFIGHVYNQKMIVTGGTPPYTFSVTTGNLPYQNIRFDTLTHTFLGTTPLATGTVNAIAVTIKIKDSYTITATKSYTLYTTYKHLTPLELSQIWSRSPMPPQYIDVFDTWHYIPMSTNTVSIYPQLLSVNGLTLSISGGNSVQIPQTATISTSGFFQNGGNSFGGNAIVGVNDNFSLTFNVNGTEKMKLLNTGQCEIGGAMATTNTALRVMGTSTSTATFIMKLRNGNGSASTIFDVRDDGFVGVGQTSQGSAERFGITGFGATGATKTAFFRNSSNTETFSVRDDGLTNLQTLKVVSTATLAGTIQYTAGSPGIGKILMDDGTGVGIATWTTPASGSQWVTQGSDIYYNSGKVSVGTTTLSALFGIVGTSTTSVTSDLLIQNSGGNNVFEIKDNYIARLGVQSVVDNTVPMQVSKTSHIGMFYGMDVGGGYWGMGALANSTLFYNTNSVYGFDFGYGTFATPTKFLSFGSGSFVYTPNGTTTSSQAWFSIKTATTTSNAFEIRNINDASMISIDYIGNIVMPVAGNGIQLKSGANQRGGNATLVGGTIAVANTTITANSVIIFNTKTAGGTLGSYSYTLNSGVGFTINSSSAIDTSTLSYFIFELN